MEKTLKIEGMMCMHCAGRVKKALEAVPGVTGAQVDLDRKQATVTLNDAVSDQALLDAVTAAGYPAALA